MKKGYSAPSIKRELTLALESDFLASVVTKTTEIETAAQKVDNHSFADASFETKWE